MLFCIKKDTGEYIFTSNLRAVSERFGVKYHKLFNKMRHGAETAEIEGLEIYKGELVKGNQRVKRKESVL